ATPVLERDLPLELRAMEAEKQSRITVRDERDVVLLRAKRESRNRDTGGGGAQCVGQRHGDHAVAGAVEQKRAAIGAGAPCPVEPRCRIPVPRGVRGADALRLVELPPANEALVGRYRRAGARHHQQPSKKVDSLQPSLPLMWSAMRSASATMVNVGL